MGGLHISDLKKAYDKIPHRLNESWNTLEDGREHLRTGWKTTRKEEKFEHW